MCRRSGVDAVADRDIHDAVFSAERHRRFGAVLGQRKKARARAAAHNDGERGLRDGAIMMRNAQYSYLTLADFDRTAPVILQRPQTNLSPFEKLCVESSDTSVTLKRSPSFSTACAGSNIADTTPRASPRSTETASTSANAAAGSPTSPNLSRRTRSAGTVGICHTRWATHGGVTDANAHPHFDQSGKLALVQTA